jgi:hypothetical protein
MRRGLKLALALVVGLAISTIVATLVVQGTTRDWFEKDVSLRAELAVSGARRSLVADWFSPHELEQQLSDLTRDERVMAAAACSRDFRLLAHTGSYPTEFSCAVLGREVFPPEGGRQSYVSTVSLPGGLVHVSAIPVAGDGKDVGFVVLVHDLSYVERREATTQRFMLLVFGVLAAASCATFAASSIAS